jgi:hypothetical protein
MTLLHGLLVRGEPESVRCPDGNVPMGWATTCALDSCVVLPEDNERQKRCGWPLVASVTCTWIVAHRLLEGLQHGMCHLLVRPLARANQPIACSIDSWLAKCR